MCDRRDVVDLQKRLVSLSPVLGQRERESAELIAGRL